MEPVIFPPSITHVWQETMIGDSCEHQTESTGTGPTTATGGSRCGGASQDRSTVSEGPLKGSLTRHVTGPFPVSSVPALAGEVAHRYRL